MQMALVCKTADVHSALPQWTLIPSVLLVRHAKNIQLPIGGCYWQVQVQCLVPYTPAFYPGVVVHDTSLCI